MVQLQMTAPGAFVNTANIGDADADVPDTEMTEAPDALSDPAADDGGFIMRNSRRTSRKKPPILPTGQRVLTDWVKNKNKSTL
eukprot:2945275-Lingulodinium_polyedra.AAC.1